MTLTTLDIGAEVESEVRRFLYLEARLLDAEDYPAWLDLLTDDVHYWVPGIECRSRRDPEGPYGEGRMAYFDDTKVDLGRRVKRMVADTAWSENPPTRHFHLVANIEVLPTETDEELLVHSVIIVHRGRYDGTGDVLYGRREDRLRRTTDGLRLARRRVVLGHSTLPSKNLNTFL